MSTIPAGSAGIDLTKLTRHNPEVAPMGYDHVAEMPEHEGGEWVRFADVQELIEQSRAPLDLDHELEAVEALLAKGARRATTPSESDERALFEAWFDAMPEKERMRTLLSGDRMVALKAWTAGRAALTHRATQPSENEDKQALFEAWAKSTDFVTTLPDGGVPFYTESQRQFLFCWNAAYRAALTSRAMPAAEQQGEMCAKCGEHRNRHTGTCRMMCPNTSGPAIGQTFDPAATTASAADHVLIPIVSGKGLGEAITGSASGAKGRN